ncbi:MAG: PD40 domain-containing protein [Planctomycetaceae bacterium]|nr:PD40 domain-containing protein [Planctomycetaceae bacterium]
MFRHNSIHKVRSNCLRLGGSLALPGVSVAAFFALVTLSAAGDEPARWIGYTQYQTKLPGGRHANIRTMRATVVRSDGTARRPVADDLIAAPDTWTQFAGWSPEGDTAVVGLGWQNPENAAWEEEHQTFRMQAGNWKLDTYFVELQSGAAVNVTGVDRVSDYNSGVFFWPNDPEHLGFTALIDGVSHPFKMDRDGHHKVDLSTGADEFTYGFSSSPDGTRIPYHKNYQIYLANQDGAGAQRVETGNAFNFAPAWSPDGQWVLFVSGEHYNCHPHVVRADGTGLRKIADRGGYRGVTEFLDVPDFHGGSSDVPVWSVDGSAIYFTALVGESVELHQFSLEGTITQLTHSKSGTTHYHPSPSPDGQCLLYGSKRNGARQLFVRRIIDGMERQLTDNAVGQGSMWAHWNPVVE